MGEKYVTETISGWGRIPVAECNVYRPETRRGLSEIVASGDQATYIPRGLGRSYGDTSLNAGGGVITTTRLNRMVGFDTDAGVLECEGGASLDEIIRTFLPRGYFLPVTPGTKYVTVAGAIANDVHGKNHHCDGSFGAFVLDFTLLTPRLDILACSREENADVFRATLGGIGLTGIILTARIRLPRVETAYIKLDCIRAGDLDEALGLMATHDVRYRYSVAWIDCLARGKNLGRSVLLYGEHAKPSDLPPDARDPLRIPASRSFAVPFDLPAGALNPLSIRLFNALYYELHPSVRGRVIDYNSYFYPLDAVDNWNRIYGRRGFVQYQVSLPPNGVPGLTRLLERLSAESRASFLAVLKRLGDAGEGILSFPTPGYTLNLDIPNGPGLVPFLHSLDRIVLDYGGRLYFAKDAVTTRRTIARMYGRALDAFREIRGRLDPDGRFSSSMSRRLGITGDGGRRGT